MGNVFLKLKIKRIVNRPNSKKSLSVLKTKNVLAVFNFKSNSIEEK